MKQIGTIANEVLNKIVSRKVAQTLSSLEELNATEEQKRIVKTRIWNLCNDIIEEIERGHK